MTDTFQKNLIEIFNIAELNEELDNSLVCPISQELQRLQQLDTPYLESQLIARGGMKCIYQVFDKPVFAPFELGFAETQPK